MTVLPAWLALSAILSFLAVIAIWARRPTGARWLAVSALLASLPATLPIAASGLSHPAPWFLAPHEKLTVLGVKMVEGEAIYILVDGNPPRYYRLPWSTQTAQQMQDAQRAAGKNGKVGVKKGQGSFFSPGQPNIWAAPQMGLPPKEGQAPAMRID